MMNDRKIKWTSGTFFFLSVCALWFCALYFTGVIGRTVKAGDYYVPSWEQENPFISCQTNTVLVVKQRYVQYSNQYGIHSDTISSFRVSNIYVGSSTENP